jgi:hypothetical protein
MGRSTGRKFAGSKSPALQRRRDCITAGAAAVNGPGTNHKAVTRQTRAISKQKWQDYLSQHNTGVPFRWLTCRDYSTCSITAAAVIGAWTLAILKVKRQEDAAAIHRRLARGQDPSRL